MTKQALPSVFVCQDLRNAVQELGKRIHPLWHRIHTNPETGYQEHLASALLGDWLGEHGFTVQRGVADMPTAGNRACLRTQPFGGRLCAGRDRACALRRSR